MVKVECHQNVERPSFLGEKDFLCRALNSQEMKSIIDEIDKCYLDKPIHVKNILDVLRAVFRVLDQHVQGLELKDRKYAAIDIIDQLIENKASSEPNSYSQQALKLLIEYSIDPIAEETLLLDGNNETSIALAKAAANNQEAIRSQVEEATNYIRMTSIEVDEKMAEIQQELNDKIERALMRVDEVKDTVKEVLEEAQVLSNEIKGEAASTVNRIAESLIEVIEVSKVLPSEAEVILVEDPAVATIEELDQKAEELENESNKPSIRLSVPEKNTKISINGLIAQEDPQL